MNKEIIVVTGINLRLITIFLVSLVLSASVFGQTSKGFVVGNVVDPNGAIVVGATVKIANTGTGVTRDAVTAEDGSFRFDAVDPGTYKIEVTLQGFKTVTRDNVIVTAAQTIETQFRLDVGTQTELVSVAAGNDVVLQTQGRCSRQHPQQTRDH
jgi:hypothetical protein